MGAIDFRPVCHGVLHRDLESFFWGFHTKIVWQKSLDVPVEAGNQDSNHFRGSKHRNIFLIRLGRKSTRQNRGSKYETALGLSILKLDCWECGTISEQELIFL